MCMFVGLCERWVGRNCAQLQPLRPFPSGGRARPWSLGRAWGKFGAAVGGEVGIPPPSIPGWWQMPLPS